MSLDLSHLEKAVASFRIALPHAEDHELRAQLGDSVHDILRAGCIYFFGYTYELLWKFMKRWIETEVSPEGMEFVVRKELFRRAAEQGLIDDVEPWFGYHKLRNTTSHTYAEAAAMNVVEQLPAFLRDATFLLEALRARNA